MICEECGDPCQDLFHDFRDPPLNEDPCLCVDCCINSLNEAIEYFENELEDLERVKESYENGH